jgi:nucleoside-diphosphate-sugar epimerase
MSNHKKVLVVGASGLVGSAVVNYLHGSGCKVTAVSRSRPQNLDSVPFVPADLFDRRACEQTFGQMSDVTHLVYTALYERSSLVTGWSDEEQIAVNDDMFKNVLDPLLGASAALRHVSLLQGTKAYGVHVRPIPVPAREDRDELRSQPNFYWKQEEHLRARASGASWGWTILRPTLIVGGGIGGAMNLLPPIGIFAALLKESGLPLAFPGGGPKIGCAVDVDLLARAIDWAGDSDTARNRTFNVTNGDVYVWENLWPAIADALGMETGNREPRSLHDYCMARGPEWDAIRGKYDLVSPGLEQFVGPSLQYCDFSMRYGETEPGPPSIVSTTKIQDAGFHDVMDTEAMFAKWFAHLQDARLLPPR